MVRCGSVHLLALTPTPEVSAAYNQRYFYAHIVDFSNLVNYSGNYVFVKSVSLRTCKRFTGKFN